MSYDDDFWNKYTEKNESNYNEEFAKFVRDLAISLRAKTVLEVGCNTGNDLRLFSNDFQVEGVDLNDTALKIAQEKLPSFKFQKGAATQIPSEDSSIDFLFTHMTLNYIPESDMPKAVNELFRVSKKYIMNCELFSEKEDIIPDHGGKCWYRNMFKRWLNFKVKIISNVEMHPEIDPDKTRFTLVRKV